MTGTPSAPDEHPPAGQVGPHGRHYAVTVRVDGESVPLKAFLHDLIGGIVTGLLKGLHNVADDPTTVEVEVRRT